MNEMVDRVAQALCETGNVEDFKCVCPHPVDGWCLGGRLQAQARIAIAAMREPTEAMEDAGQGEDLSGTESVDLIYRAMIDAALAE